MKTEKSQVLDIRKNETIQEKNFNSAEKRLLLFSVADTVRYNPHFLEAHI